MPGHRDPVSESDGSQPRADDAQRCEDLDIDPTILADEDEEHPWLGVKSEEELIDGAIEQGWSENDIRMKLEEFSHWESQRPPTRKDVIEQNQGMLARRRDFRIAAQHVATAFARIQEVTRIVLFGSVACPLKKEVPRFREFRRAGIAIWHECTDVDLAVWLTDLGCLERLRKARGKALNELFRETEIGVAHHQVEVFVFQPGTNHYRGRLCCFNRCPKGKRECEVSGCGATPFLKQHEDFTFDQAALEPEKSVVLFDRDRPGGCE